LKDERVGFQFPQQPDNNTSLSWVWASIFGIKQRKKQRKTNLFHWM